jgi:Lar family restriction alleviation protein
MDKLAPIPELLPCPCCGGKAHLTKREGFGPAGGKYSRGYVSCRKCNLTTPTKSPWKAAVERWNRRSAAVTPEIPDEWALVPTDLDDGVLEVVEDYLSERRSYGRSIYASDVWAKIIETLPAAPSLSGAGGDQ